MHFAETELRNFVGPSCTLLWSQRSAAPRALAANCEATLGRLFPGNAKSRTQFPQALPDSSNEPQQLEVSDVAASWGYSMRMCGQAHSRRSKCTDSHRADRSFEAPVTGNKLLRPRNDLAQQHEKYGCVTMLIYPACGRIRIPAQFWAHGTQSTTPPTSRIEVEATYDMLDRKHQIQSRPSSSLGVWNRFRSLSGWRKSAIVNTVLVSAVFLVLLICHIVLWATSGHVAGYQIIYSERCADNAIGRLNTLFHLMINVLSSLVLASTNFFMQVLNAPSREELDNAHEKGSWLDVGIPSPRNVFRVSRFKRIMWILFFLSSVPIHLLFNSAIFATDHRESTFSYFVFDESVLNGGAAYDPGTRLAIPYDYKILQDHAYLWSNDSRENSTELYGAREMYFNSDHEIRSLIIRDTVESIRNGSWHRLDKHKCRSIYSTTQCDGLRTYSNVALVLSGSSGWNRSVVWDLPASESSYWDAYMPNNVNNSLWSADIYLSNSSHEPCQIQMYGDGETGTQKFCNNNCNRKMGLHDANTDLWIYSLFPTPSFDSDDTWYDLSPDLLLNSTSPEPAFENAQLSVEYCLAEPIETICQIGLASTLLWVVSFCVLLKAVLCIVVIVKLEKHTSLVTPGDVIESFISHPPEYSLGSCLLDSRSLVSDRKSNGHSLLHGPVQWTSKRHRRWHAIPKHVWWTSYLIFATGVVLLITFFVMSFLATHWQGSFSQNVANKTIGFPFSPTFEQAILIANSPQLFLSFAYLALNGLFTRFHMAKEWAAMSTRYKALRVTNPKGQQISTYFLQLPYRYSVPLLIISILLHWVLSGCIYLLVMQGGYFGYDTNGPFDSFMALGFSTKSLFTMLTLSIVLSITLPFFGRMSLPPNTVVVGSNSLAIAAACQVSPLTVESAAKAYFGKTGVEYNSAHQENEIELRHLMAPSPSLLTGGDQASATWNDEEDRKTILFRVSQSKIRWGVVKMPPSWAEQFNRRDTEVEHISFGVPEDDVQEPVPGHWYA
ncbi:hypothetical protein KVR01_006051 [Diaporthe batatas]|uniref:uncharacterized protein n=1 Tax=Diaporthe batatas TaxID=748121 RepID=UPI001D042F3C|nr:uncharacterized protein KVR01_006051 [Diaporthe batatas]KAG8164133.1 hypothetical protein KVR01_006051 [Diaporthe batatas]